MNYNQVLYLKVPLFSLKYKYKRLTGPEVYYSFIFRTPLLFSHPRLKRFWVSVRLPRTSLFTNEFCFTGYPLVVGGRVPYESFVGSEETMDLIPLIYKKVVQEEYVSYSFGKPKRMYVRPLQICTFNSSCRPYGFGLYYKCIGLRSSNVPVSVL